MTTVLVMINDLGFQFWLAERLAAGGFFVIPAKNPAKARNLLARLQCAVDVVIVNPTLAGTAKFIETLRRSQGYLNVFSIPDLADDPSQTDWVASIRKALSFSATA